MAALLTGLLAYRNTHPPMSREEQLQSLKALPYVQWTERAIDPSLRGVRKYDKGFSSPGYNLFTNDADQVVLMDMSGKVVHVWSLPGKKQCEHAEMIKDGGIIAVCVSQALVKVNWDSQVVWEDRIPVHHDVAVLPNGSMFAIYKGRPEKYNGYIVDFDSVARVSANGKNVGKWSTFENRLQLSKFHPASPLDIPRNPEAEKAREESTRYDYYHLNAIQVLPDTPLGRKDKRFQRGNLLLCFRNINMIAILDRDSWNVEWTWGTGTLDFPHMPRMLRNGHILVFDNGTHRKYSRVLELEPTSGRIVWQYKGHPPESFFSAWRGSNQRLPNGNTLICDSENGHAFEITSEGKIVWDFWNPEIRDSRRKRIYRIERLPSTLIEPLLQK